MDDIKMKKRIKILIIVIVLLLFIIYFNSKNSRNCPTNFNDIFENHQLSNKNAKIFAITPTYSRPVQKAELTRLAQTLMLVPNLHWIIIEDSNTTSKLVENFLKRTQLSHRSTLLNIKTPENYKLKNPNWSKPRGVEQRNLALAWIRNFFKERDYFHSLIFFMDDDNSYSLELFEEISKIKPSKVGVWPVGLVGGLKVEKPILNENNEVESFNSLWRPERPFPLDMAGFAIATDLIISNPEASFSYEVQRGYQESEILRYVTTRKELQPLANLCKDVLVWHTRTERPKLDGEDLLRKKGLTASDAGMDI